MTIVVEGRRPMTANWAARAHRSAVRMSTRWWRAAGRDAWTSSGYGRQLAPVAVVAVPLHATMASPQDVGACLPAVKAVIDGIVDAGGLDDDHAEIVRSITLRAPERNVGVDGLRLSVQSVERV